MKTILVPNDFSKNANNALQYAIALAKEKSLKVIILHTFQKDHGDLKKTTKPKEDKLSSLCNSIASLHNIVCEFINTEGILLNVITDTIHEIHPDFVIMGTKGARGIKEILLGSNAERVIKNAKCPVIIIPKKESFKGIKNITYATNYYYSSKNPNAIATMLELIEFAKIFSAQINVVEVCDEECIGDDVKKYMNNFKEKVSRATTYKKISFSLIFGNEELRLEEFSKATSSNLLAISIQNRILVDKFFHAATETKAINRRELPLMVLHHTTPHTNPLIIREQEVGLLSEKFI